MKKIALYLILVTSLTISCKTSTSNATEGAKAKIEQIDSTEHPKRVNQKFYTSFNDKDTLKVKSFFGPSGIEYPTYEEALYNNGTDENILIKNIEHGGVSKLKESFLFENQNVKEPFSPLHENYGLNQSLQKSVWEDVVNRNYQKIIDKGISENLIQLKKLEEIGKLLDLKSNVSWKLNMKRVDKDLVKYSLFAYPSRFYGDPEFPSFLEIETTIDNSKNPNKLNSFDLKLKPDIDMNKFEEIGVNPKFIKDLALKQ